jgi:hypothetical protein
MRRYRAINGHFLLPSVLQISVFARQFVRLSDALHSSSSVVHSRLSLGH